MSFYERPATSILHPTDFSEASETAFAHALALAIANKARLTILHVLPDHAEETPWSEYPAVRKTLEKWGRLEPGAAHHDVGTTLGIEIEKSMLVNKDVVKSIVKYVEKEFFDMIVMATDENRELPFSFGHHIAVPVSQKTHLPTFFIPQDVKGCVSPENGVANLKQVLVPVDREPNAQPALDRIAWSMENLSDSEMNITLLYVGAENDFPKLRTVEMKNATWSREIRHGDPTMEIVRSARKLDADVIAMVTEGQKGFWDIIRGSTVQRVLRKAPCPIFTMPAGI
jgi:nucleotide-binding universal stress UspA family protein